MKKFISCIIVCFYICGANIANSVSMTNTAGNANTINAVNTTRSTNLDNISEPSNQVTLFTSDNISGSSKKANPLKPDNIANSSKTTNSSVSGSNHLNQTVLSNIHANKNKSTIVCIAGGTGAGKTTVAKKIYNGIKDNAVMISQDSYYKDLSHLPESERIKTNFDHPNSLDFALLKKHIQMLQSGKAIVVPTYDFKTHTRTSQTTLVQPKKIIIVEGILLLAAPELKDTFDLKVFVDADDDIRLLRRIKRDMQERNRTFASINEQYLSTVRPMHKVFVEPSKYNADIIIPSYKENNIAVNMIVDKLKFKLDNG